MSAEHGGHGQSRGITPAEAIGVTAEVGVITLGAYEIIIRQERKSEKKFT